MSREFLQDRRFLNQLNNLHIKTQYIKITVLNWKEQPLEQVQGKVISGSVNLDGSSSMRRTATLSILATEKDNNLANLDHLFSVNKKCKIQLGIVNTVPEFNYSVLQDKEIVLKKINYQNLYGDIIWFPLGIYIMFNPSIAHGTDGITISMQCKDKMCLLNGDLGGQIHSGVDFTSQEEETDGDLCQVFRKSTLVYNIIQQLVNHWGKENLSKIIISEVPLYIKAVAKWTGVDPVYLYYNGNRGYQLSCQELSGWTKVKTIYQYYDVGYTYEDFTFPGELTCNPGETVTSVLDKIINILGNYEYFYDVDGNFIFREKPNYLNMTNTAYWLKEQGVSVETDVDKIANIPSDQYSPNTYQLTKSVYSFEDGTFTTNLNNSLNFNNIKNDFVVWGAFKSANNNDISKICRFHLAIDKKPDIGIQHNDLIFYRDNYDIVRGIKILNPNTSNPPSTITIGGQEYEIVEYLPQRQSQDWRQEIYYQMLDSEATGINTNTQIDNSYFQYYAELKEQFPKIFDLTSGTNPKLANGWTQDFIDHPEQIGYFLDFIDEKADLGKYSVNNIGRRSFIVNDDTGINCVFEPTIPDIVYIDPYKSKSEEVQIIENNLDTIGQRWIQIDSSLYDQFATGGVLNSCYEKIKDLLYQYTHVNNSISITTIPIYHLEPGSRIAVVDKKSGIDDDFIIQSISLPLDVTSTMNINAYKALQKI